MNWNTLTHVAAVLILGVHLFGCETASPKLTQEETIHKLRLELREARTRYLTEWRTFKSDTEREIELNTMKIDVIKDIMIHAGPLAVKKYRVDMCALQRLNRQLNAGLEEYTLDGHTKRDNRSDRIVANYKEY